MIVAEGVGFDEGPVRLLLVDRRRRDVQKSLCVLTMVHEPAEAAGVSFQILRPVVRPHHGAIYDGGKIRRGRRQIAAQKVNLDTFHAGFRQLGSGGRIGKPRCGPYLIIPSKLQRRWQTDLTCCSRDQDFFNFGHCEGP